MTLQSPSEFLTIQSPVLLTRFLFFSAQPLRVLQGPYGRLQIILLREAGIRGVGCETTRGRLSFPVLTARSIGAWNHAKRGANAFLWTDHAESSFLAHCASARANVS